MNSKINKKLNIAEFLFTIIALGLYGLSMYFGINEITFNKTLLLVLGIVFLLSIAIVESFLFILMKPLYRLIYVLYAICLVVFSFPMCGSYPFFIILYIFCLCLMKNICRVVFIDKIFIKNEFYRYCKMFNIKVKREYKRRAKTTSKKKFVTTSSSESDSRSNSKVKGYA